MKNTLRKIRPSYKKKNSDRNLYVRPMKIKIIYDKMNSECIHLKIMHSRKYCPRWSKDRLMAKKNLPSPAKKKLMSETWDHHELLKTERYSWSRQWRSITEEKTDRRKCGKEKYKNKFKKHTYTHTLFLWHTRMHLAHTQTRNYEKIMF